MHDATEGGVRTAAWEMAVASGRGLEADLSRAHVDPTAHDVAGLFGMEPLDASSEGTLLLAVDPDRVGDVTAALRSGGSTVSRLGRFTRRPQVLRDGVKILRPAANDSYWAAVRRENRSPQRRYGR